MRESCASDHSINWSPAVGFHRTCCARATSSAAAVANCSRFPTVSSSSAPSAGEARAALVASFQLVARLNFKIHQPSLTSQAIRMRKIFQVCLCLREPPTLSSWSSSCPLARTERAAGELATRQLGASLSLRSPPTAFYCAFIKPDPGSSAPCLLLPHHFNGADHTSSAPAHMAHGHARASQPANRLTFRQDGRWLSLGSGARASD